MIFYELIAKSPFLPFQATVANFSIFGKFKITPMTSRREIKFIFRMTTQMTPFLILFSKMSRLIFPFYQTRYQALDYWQQIYSN